ncbi:CBS domain-containing protein [Streptomyces sp. NPDC002825]|uniref:CBS domain-containing protein n=1 Tax=Streptomyces sp. NPDC002825 TaxID=3154666 RepID=UPI00331F583D
MNHDQAREFFRPAVVDGAGRVIGVVWDLEAWERAKAEGTRAEELMSVPAVCARPDWTVAETARLMEVQKVERLVVVDDEEQPVGIVSRHGLLGIFLREDDDIRREIVEDVLGDTLRLEPTALAVEVRDGRVDLAGRLPFRGMIPAIERMVATVDGVVSVSCTRLTYDVDDTERGGTRS